MRELSLQEVDAVNGAWICTPYNPSASPTMTCTNNNNGLSLADAMFLAGYPGAQ